MPPRRRDAAQLERPARGRITVIAGVNGAGKSSIIGAMIREIGGRYFDPDEEARALYEAHQELSPDEANEIAWEMGRRGLEQAIARKEDFTFETTLGGQTITALLTQALETGLEVVMSYIGLDSPERHLARVRSRVALGGHDIPEAAIRRRYTASREHLVALLPRLTDLTVYDNSLERDPKRDEAPVPILLLRMMNGRIAFVASKERISSWAHPIVAAAILSDRAQRSA